MGDIWVYHLKNEVENEVERERLCCFVLENEINLFTHWWLIRKTEFAWEYSEKMDVLLCIVCIPL